ncbi:hypothetical protein FJZ55_09875, partial [Candidatus Woesearchaeota archaeon]|nr:hypothetical protein [Candidatus Woesearchaeota archaeon]
MNTIKQLLTEVNSIGFWGRIFGWGRVKNLIATAMADLEVLLDRATRYDVTLGGLQEELSVSKTETRGKTEQLMALEKTKATSDAELTKLREEVSALRQENAVLKNEEEKRIRERDQAVGNLTKIQEKIQRDQDAFVAEQAQKEIDRLENMKATWAKHQIGTAERIKSLCQKHTIQYLKEVPFKGEPDNTVFICDEHIVFDAKSPAGDDLGNFPTYLKSQAEKAIKYAKQEGVKKDIYFVVPSNTLEHLSQFVYPHADHDVYIISADSLEPILLSLQKIEEYEFAKELTPDQRANICRVIGRFAHLAKRRVQVDNYFATQTIELAYACENYLPEEIMNEVKEYEKAEKLNPPQEKRVKNIPVG